MRFGFLNTDKELTLKKDIAAALAKQGIVKVYTRNNVMASKIVIIFNELRAIGGPCTADELWLSLYNKKLISLSFATLYKYLNWLAAIGMVERIKKDSYRPDIFKALC